MHNKKSLNKSHLNTAQKLGITATICLLSIYGLFLLTKDNAKNSENNYLLQSLIQVLPKNSFTNDLLATRKNIENKIAYQACQYQRPNFKVYEIRTNKGYNGLIKMLISIDLSNNSIYQVQPLFHQETPGLGDQIDINKSPWLEQFNLLLSTPANNIAIQQDKGDIDAITGATITSRAVTNAIRQQIFLDKSITLPGKCE